jgi:hypothetical protein
MYGNIRITAFIVLALAFARAASSQQANAAHGDALQRHVSAIELNEQDIVDGIAMLTQGVGLAVSVEYPLGLTISAPARQLKSFTAKVGPGTVAEVADELCALDPTLTWKKDGNMLNVLPRSVADDPSYFLNRQLDSVTFQDVQGAQDAVFKTAAQLPGPKEQIAMFQPGMSLDFSSPWSTTLSNLTVRQVFDAIAHRFGATYGWQFSGARDFRMITFHAALRPKPSRNKQAQRHEPGTPME